MNALRSLRPGPTEHAGFYSRYVAAVPDGDIVEALRRSGRELVDDLALLRPEQALFRYADGKWTIATLLGHVVDTERIFAYRALRIARGDTTPLPGFDENTFAATAGSDTRAISDIVDELGVVRQGTVQLFASLPDDAWMRSGTVNDTYVTVRALAWITAGHLLHHVGILRTRYGVHLSGSPMQQPTMQATQSGSPEPP